MAESEVKKGDEVSWGWAGGRPAGTAAEVKTGEVSMTTARGNEVKRQGEESNPAVRVERSGHDVVKKASELEVEAEGPEHKKAGESTADAGKKEEGLKAPAAGGRGRSKSPNVNAGAAEKKDDKKEDGLKPPAAGRPKSKSPKPAEDKKADKKEGKAAAANAEPKKKGRRPKGSGGGAKSGDKPKKRAATETGEPRRSKRTKT